MTMTMSYKPVKCIKTGCALMVEDYNGWAWGDLHAQGDTYIFNAVCRRGEAVINEVPLTEEAMLITLLPEGHYFERRGVYVFNRNDAVPSKALNEHFKLWEPDNVRR